MKVAYAGNGVKLIHGDALEVLKRLPDNSIDSVVTDPPYGIDFMGKDWDNSVKLANRMLGQISTDGEKSASGPLRKGGTHSQGLLNHDGLAFELWVTSWAQECFRVLKPGGHIVSFGGARTWHRLAAGIEDAGFEIRDSLAWLYGTGFPKNMDMAKAVDKSLGVKGEYGDPKSAAHAGWIDRGRMRGAAEGNENEEGWQRPWMQDEEAVGNAARKYLPASDEGQQWDGWGTALKPAFEPIVLGRKPLSEKTVAANVLKWGTGAINIDGTRIPTGDKLGGGHSTGGQQMADGWKRPWMDDPDAVQANADRSKASVAKSEELGRHPANVVLTHSDGCEFVGIERIKAITGSNSGRGAGKYSESSDIYGTYNGQEDLAPGAPTGRGGADGTEAVESWQCVEGCPVAELDRQAPSTGAAAPATGPTKSGHHKSSSMAGAFKGTDEASKFHGGDKAGASRFFYVAKPGQKERPNVDGVKHPTVKPLTLIEWLVVMVTPPGGIVLDPFVGSGTTLEAVLNTGFKGVGIELTEEYIPLGVQRIERAVGRIENVA